jgi:hypothetical protein
MSLLLGPRLFSDRFPSPFYQKRGRRPVLCKPADLPGCEAAVLCFCNAAV